MATHLCGAQGKQQHQGWGQGSMACAGYVASAVTAATVGTQTQLWALVCRSVLHGGAPSKAARQAVTSLFMLQLDMSSFCSSAQM